MTTLQVEMADFAIDAESDPIEAFRDFRAGADGFVILDMLMPDIGGTDLHGKRSEKDRRKYVYLHVRRRV